jgi:predicted SAM-dependent methyltransferase
VAFARALWNVDVVHDFWALPAYYDIIRAMRIKIVATVAHLNSRDQCPTLHQAHMILSTCEESRGELQTWCGIHPTRIGRVDLGVDGSVFSPKDAHALREKMGVIPGQMTIGFFVKPALQRKGENYFIEALRLAKKEISPFVVLLGKGHEDIAHRLREMEIPFFAGFVPGEELPMYYSALDAYVITSLKEGGPLTAFEAMACGVPVITTPVGLIQEIITPGKNGIIVRKENSKEVAAALKKLYTNPTWKKKIARAGRKSINYLEWKNVMARARPEINKLYDPEFYAGNASSKADAQKLEIGSGSNPIPGFVHVDARALENTDVVADTLKGLPFPNGAFQEVRSRHTIEHFPREKVPLVLKEWARVLKKDGLLVVEFPDARKIAQAYVEGKIPTKEFSRLMYGDQDYPFNFHMAGFDGEFMGEILKKLGLRVEKIEAAEMHLPGNPLWGCRVTARKK